MHQTVFSAMWVTMDANFVAKSFAILHELTAMVKKNKSLSEHPFQ
jgi:hypothetical protein